MLVVAEVLEDASGVVRICFLEVAQLKPLDPKGSLTEGLGDRLRRPLLFVFREEPPQVAALGVVVVVLAMIVACDGDCAVVCGDLVGAIPVLWVLLGPAEAVGLVVGQIAEVAVEAHGAVAVVVGDVTLCSVDR